MNMIETMKAAEIAMAEREAGIAITTLEDPNYPKTNLLIALAWVIARRENPKLTFKAYGESKTLLEVTQELGLVEEEDK